MLIALALALAGCSGDGGEDDDHCEDGHADEHCPAPTTSRPGPSTNTTVELPKPNQLPLLVVTTFDDKGNATQVALPGDNITFSAKGSTDPDGQIQNIAVTVFDDVRKSGETKQLFANGAFMDQTFNFSSPGVATALVSMVDDDSGFNSTEVKVYVNEPQSTARHGFTLAHPSGDPTTCAGPVDALVDSNVWKKFSFQVREGATYIEATAELTHPADMASIEFAICTPQPDASTPGEPISEAATDTVMSTPGAELNASLDYYISAYSHAPQTNAGFNLVVHYEPDTREAAGDE